VLRGNGTSAEMKGTLVGIVKPQKMRRKSPEQTINLTPTKLSAVDERDRLRMRPTLFALRPIM